MLSMQRAVPPWEAQLVLCQNTLVLNSLRSRLPHFKIKQVVLPRTLQVWAVATTLKMIQMLALHKRHQRLVVLAPLAKSAWEAVSAP